MVSLRNTLLQSDNLRRPADLEHQLQASSTMTEEANRSLVTLLQVPACLPRLPTASGS